MKLLQREEGECEKNGQDQQGTKKISKHAVEIKEPENTSERGIHRILYRRLTAIFKGSQRRRHRLRIYPNETLYGRGMEYPKQ